MRVYSRVHSDYHVSVLILYKIITLTVSETGETSKTRCICWICQQNINTERKLAMRM